MKENLSENSTVVATKDLASCDLAGEAAILDLKSGVYYGLDAVAASIWNLIREPKTVGDIRDAVLSEYDVEPDRCEQDLLAWLQQMADAGLVEIS
jgi:hypothetical protein